VAVDTGIALVASDRTAERPTPALDLVSVAAPEPAEDAFFFRIQQRLYQVCLELSRLARYVRRGGPFVFEPLVDPGYEQHVPQACLDGARAGKELVR
jgi:hypothetical protein